MVCFCILFIPIDKQIAVSYQSLELLQEHGIAATDIAKLQAAGYHTVESVRCYNPLLVYCMYPVSRKSISSFSLFSLIDRTFYSTKIIRCEGHIRSEGIEIKRDCQSHGTNGLQNCCRCIGRSQVRW